MALWPAAVSASASRVSLGTLAIPRSAPRWRTPGAATDRPEVQRPELAVVEFDVRVPAAVVQRLEVDRFDVGGHELVEGVVVRGSSQPRRGFSPCAPR